MATPMADDYFESARTQGYAVELMIPAFKDAVTSALGSLPPGQTTLRVVDLGVADGVNTGSLIATLLSCASSSPAVKDIELGLLDLPGNDWAVLAKTSLAWTASAVAAGLRLHVRMIPQSFYGVFAPPGSLDVVWACTALHWAAGTGDDAGELDTVLRNVASALRPGGTFVATTPTLVLSEAPGHAVLNRWWMRDTAAAESVPAYRTLEMSFEHAVHPWTLEEWRGRLVAAAGSLTVCDLSIMDIPDLYWRDASDADDYARKHTASCEAVMEGILQRLSPDDRTAVLVAVAAAARAAYAAAPGGAPPPADGVSVIVRATRV